MKTDFITIFKFYVFVLFIVFYLFFNYKTALAIGVIYSLDYFDQIDGVSISIHSSTDSIRTRLEKNAATNLFNQLAQKYKIVYYKHVDDVPIGKSVLKITANYSHTNDGKSEYIRLRIIFEKCTIQHSTNTRRVSVCKTLNIKDSHPLQRRSIIHYNINYLIEQILSDYLEIKKTK